MNEQPEYIVAKQWTADVLCDFWTMKVQQTENAMTVSSFYVGKHE